MIIYKEHTEKRFINELGPYAQGNFRWLPQGHCVVLAPCYNNWAVGSVVNFFMQRYVQNGIDE